MDKFTKEQQVQAVYDLKVGYTLGHADIAMLKSMARQLLASMEQEPVAYMHHSGQVVTRGECCDDKIFAICCKVETPLYATPPSPVVPDDLLSMAASAIEDLLEHTDPSTSYYSGVWADVSGKLRAAMLQGAEPVSEHDELPLDYLQGHKDGLEWAAQMAEANNPQTGDWLYDDPIKLARAIRKGPDMPEFKSESVDEDDNFYSWFGRFWYENYQKNNYTTSAKQMLGTMAEFAYRAGRESAALAGNSPASPDGWQLVPKEPTAENGAKSVLSGEFSETKFINCPVCFGDDDCETCDGSGRIEITVPVTWTTIKAIWAKGVEHLAAAPQQEDL